MEFRPFFVLPPAFLVAEREASANNRGAVCVTPKTVHMSTHPGSRLHVVPEPDGALLLCSQRLFVFFVLWPKRVPHHHGGRCGLEGRDRGDGR